jgi:hypothetical protein
MDASGLGATGHPGRCRPMSARVRWLMSNAAAGAVRACYHGWLAGGYGKPSIWICYIFRRMGRSRMGCYVHCHRRPQKSWHSGNRLGALSAIRPMPRQKRTAARQRKQLSEAGACYSSGSSNRESWVPFGGERVSKTWPIAGRRGVARRRAPAGSLATVPVALYGPAQLCHHVTLQSPKWRKTHYLLCEVTATRPNLTS